MDIFSLIGLLFLLYNLIYLIFLTASDCDVRLCIASIFQTRNLNLVRGKIVWVTGASSGIGEYIAKEFAKYGAKLVLTARNESELQRVKQACLEIGGLKDQDVLVLPLDITEVHKHQSSFNKVIQHFKKLDILVNNAGRSQRAVWEQIDLEVDKQMFELNVFATLSLSRIAAKYFLERNDGHIAVTSSVAALTPLPYSPTYCATKASLHSYFGSLVREHLDKNVRVTLLCPGPVVSNLLPAAFTSVSGAKFGKPHIASERRMKTERCAYLSVLAIANNLTEVWIARFPVLLLTYFSVYFPNITLWGLRKIGNRIYRTLRDQTSN